MGRRHVGLSDPAGTRVGILRPWGILGGTFDPIHLGHLAVAEQTRQDLDLAGVLFIPAAQSPLKPERPISPPEQRVAMVELAIAGNDGFRVSRMELDRPGPSYTVDTLLALHAAGTIAGADNPDPVLILSVETLPALVHWREPERLLDLCRVAIVPRRGYEGPQPGWLEARFPRHADRFTMLDGPDLGPSASDIRGRIATGRSIRYLVPDAVGRYIETYGLYGADGQVGGR